MVSKLFVFRQRLAGALLLAALLALVAGSYSVHVPLNTPFGTLARVFDSLAVHMLIGAAALALVAALLGARLAGGLLLLGTLAALGYTAAEHARRSLPLVEEPAALRLTYLNVLNENRLPPERVLDGVAAVGPDVAAFSESVIFERLGPEVRRDYPEMLGCDPGCRVFIQSRLPVSGAELSSLARLWDDRYGQVSVTTADGRRMTLVVAHLSKPWFSGIVENEEWEFIQRLNAIEGPLVVVGDFNAAPWSRSVRRLMDETGLAAARLPVATWPTEAGALGVPIDNVFVRGGARLVSLAAFGEDLGSNHRGLLMDIALPPA